MAVTLRDMDEDDLPLLVHWLAQPHVVRWWYETPTLDQARAKYLPRLAGADSTHMLIVVGDGVPIGLAQWYEWDEEPADRDNNRVGPGELGVDYTIGELGACYRGLGTEMVARLLELLRERYPAGTPVSVTPEAANLPSRRILEKNGFELVEVFQSDPLPGAHPTGPTARYRRLL